MKKNKLVVLNDGLLRGIRAAAYHLDQDESEVIRQALYMYLPSLSIPDVDSALAKLGASKSRTEEQDETNQE